MPTISPKRPRIEESSEEMSDEDQDDMKDIEQSDRDRVRNLQPSDMFKVKVEKSTPKVPSKVVPSKKVGLENSSQEATSSELSASENFNSGSRPETPDTQNQKSGPGRKASKKASKSKPEMAIYTRIKKLLSDIHKHKHAWLFKDPVTEAIAPEYFTIIKYPMDLKTMAGKNKDRKYKSVKDFISDFNLMIQNCRTYNGEDETITPMCDAVNNYFLTKVKNDL